MSNITLHRADTRGHAQHQWLDAFHTFSFADYYDPTRMQFGALRVLNNDTIAPGKGFGTHPHDNMEIITIPLSGSLEHRDSMGNTSVIHAGEVQVMSAGTGVAHSEYNASQTEPIELLQIWVRTKTRGVTPRYDEHSYLPLSPDSLTQVVSPDPEDAGTWIHQDAWFHLGTLSSGKGLTYNLKKPGNGVYIFVIEGDIKIQDTLLRRRDGIGIV